MRSPHCYTQRSRRTGAVIKPIQGRHGPETRQGIPRRASDLRIKRWVRAWSQLAKISTRTHYALRNIHIVTCQLLFVEPEYYRFVTILPAVGGPVFGRFGHTLPLAQSAPRGQNLVAVNVCGSLEPNVARQFLRCRRPGRSTASRSFDRARYSAVVSPCCLGAVLRKRRFMGGRSRLASGTAHVPGNPFCGGQGIYVRHLSRELHRLGHEVDVLSGPPYPTLDEGVRLIEVPSLDLYREPDPFRMPRRGEYRDWIDVAEVGVMMTAGFPEPLTFSLRARRLLKATGRALRRRSRQPDASATACSASKRRWSRPCITRSRSTARSSCAADPGLAPVLARRWYGFTTMQRRVARQLRARDHGVGVLRDPDHRPPRCARRADQVVIPVGTDIDHFSPDPTVPGCRAGSSRRPVPTCRSRAWCR